MSLLIFILQFSICNGHWNFSYSVPSSHLPLRVFAVTIVFMTRAFIGIGSNVGDRQGYLDLARRELSALPRTKLVRFSSTFETAPVGPVHQGAFFNAAAELETELDPFDLLDGLAAIEGKAGREPRRTRVKWGPRTLDLDILLYGDRVISSDELVVPHPMLHERWFVLKPLAELDADLVHPVLEMRIGELLKYLEQSEASEKGIRDDSGQNK